MDRQIVHVLCCKEKSRAGIEANAQAPTWADVGAHLLVQKYEYEPTMPMTSELETLQAKGGH